LFVLFVTQAIAAVGLAAGGTAGGLLAEEIAGTAAVGALPLGLLVVGAGVSAPLVTALMKRRSRRTGLIVALLVAIAGTIMVLLGAAVLSLWLVLAGSLLFGAGNTSVMLARYIAADFSPPERLGRAVSTMMFAVTLGAVGGPSLLGPTAGVARAIALPDGAGLYLVSVIALSVAAGLLFALPATTPSEQGRAHEPANDVDGLAGATTIRKIFGEIARIPRVPVAILASANFTMVAVMSLRRCISMFTAGAPSPSAW
jgi:MFS family permease